MAAASTLEEFIDLTEQLLDDGDPAGRRLVFFEMIGEILPNFLRGSAHPNDESCAFCCDDTIWRLFEQPDQESPGQGPCSIQENAAILAQLATELINNSHSLRALQAVTRAFSR